MQFSVVRQSNLQKVHVFDMNYSLYKEMLAVEFEVKLELVFFLSLNFCELSFIFFPFVCTSKLLLTDTLFSCFVHIISQENSLDNLKKCSSTVFHMFHVEVHRIKQKT